MGRENILKMNEICYCLGGGGGGGGIQNLGGEISPPKGPEKNTGERPCHLSFQLLLETELSVLFN